MIVEPEGTVYSHLDASAAKAVYRGVMGDGPPAPQFELSPAEYKPKKK
jgi:hypothetical protein